MNHFFRCFTLGAAFVGAVSAVALAQGAKVEGTPVPTPPKPDLSSMKFLIGTWTCSDLSSRRPGPFTTTEVYSMDPSGYWVVRDDTIHTASWIPREVHSQTKYTWDAGSDKWIRITTGDGGQFAIATAPMPTGSEKTYTYTLQSSASGIASYAPEVYNKVSNTKKTMKTSFTEKSGRLVNVTETCTKS